MDHEELEEIFNEYADESEDENYQALRAERKLENDVSDLLKSKFFKKGASDASDSDLSLDTEDVQDELAATLGGVYTNVEKGVGAQMTEADDEDEETDGYLNTEDATSEVASTTQ